jgi:molecular chaperone DnaJ
MDSKAAYSELGLLPGCTRDEIRRKFGQLALQCHPDQHPNDPRAAAKFDILHAAYRTLGNQPAVEYTRTQAPPPTWRPGSDIMVTVPVSLETLCNGGPISIPLAPDVFGSPIAKPMFHSDVCTACKGVGTRTMTRGILRVKGKCTTCNGEGSIRKGSIGGQPASGDFLEINLPQQTTYLKPYRILGRGEPGLQGAPWGDLLVNLKPTPHSRFQTSGANLLATAKVSFADLCLGGQVSIPPLDGGKPVKFAFPAGTRAGATREFQGGGLMKADGSANGNLIVRLMPTVPTMLTAAQKSILKKWRKAELALEGRTR